MCWLREAIFRMYFDGFPEDRNMVLSHHNNFINNIMLVIHFEMTLGSTERPFTMASNLGIDHF